MSGDDRATDPCAALVRARGAAETHMTGMLANDHMWDERTVTDLLLVSASPDVRFQKFTWKEESRETGADWLWWILDADGTCFGMLVQAKSLKREGRRWLLDFEYTTKKSTVSQMDRLMAAAAPFEVPASYVLYCGDAEYRADLSCDFDKRGQTCGCRDRPGASVCTLTAQVAQQTVLLYEEDAPQAAFHQASPLENLADPDRPDPPLFPPGKALPPELLRYLRSPQSGARRAAKALLRPAVDMRNGQFTAATLDLLSSHSDALFPELPSDQGHFGQPYLTHVLQGLRARPPGYVLDVLAGRTPPPWVTEAVAGVVVVQEPRAGAWALPLTTPVGGAAPESQSRGGAGAVPQASGDRRSLDRKRAAGNSEPRSALARQRLAA